MQAFFDRFLYHLVRAAAQFYRSASCGAKEGKINITQPISEEMIYQAIGEASCSCCAYREHRSLP